MKYKETEKLLNNLIYIDVSFAKMIIIFIWKNFVDEQNLVNKIWLYSKNLLISNNFDQKN